MFQMWVHGHEQHSEFTFQKSHKRKQIKLRFQGV